MRAKDKELPVPSVGSLQAANKGESVQKTLSEFKAKNAIRQ
jgi:hypothetical protein